MRYSWWFDPMQAGTFYAVFSGIFSVLTCLLRSVLSLFSLLMFIIWDFGNNHLSRELKRR